MNRSLTSEPHRIMATASQLRDPTLVGKAIRQASPDSVPDDLPLERDFREGSEYDITDHVRALHARLTAPHNPRLGVLVDRLVFHLHAFARDVELRHEEWATAIDLIGRAGKESTAGKDEVVLMSDVLGVSALVDELEHPRPDGCTSGCEEGPFYTKDFPDFRSGCRLSHADTVGQPMFFRGSIKNLRGEAVQNAKVEVVSNPPSYL
jgi:hypothetical protein